MSAMGNGSCPSNRMLQINGSNISRRCICSPGHFYIPEGNNGLGGCVNFFQVAGGWSSTSSRGSLPILSGLAVIPLSVLSITFIVLVLWLLLSVPVLVLAPVSGIGYRFRCFLKEMDRRYSCRHWIDTEKCLVGKSTELGGIMTMSSWIVFTALASSLAFEAIKSDTVTVQYLNPARRDDIEKFRNDLEINVYAIGQIQCSQLVGSNFSLTSEPEYMTKENADGLRTPTCSDTKKGVTLRVICKSCILSTDIYTFTWQFKDQPSANSSAYAVGFETVASAKTFRQYSTLKAVIPGGQPGILATLRGSQWNVISLNLVPRIFNSKGDQRLFQMTLHKFIPGSSFVTAKDLEESFLKTQGVNIALQIKVLSQYLVETTHCNYFGIVRFLAYLGGSHILCRCLFLFIMLQLEMKFPRLLIQEKCLNKLIAKERARTHWAKIRMYVQYGIFDKHAITLKQKKEHKKRHKRKKDLDKQILHQKVTSTGLSNGEKHIASSRYIVRQYRKPNWIHELDALPTVPEPFFLEDCSGQDGKYSDIEVHKEYLKKLSSYNERLRRDFLANLAVLEKLTCIFEQKRA